nr:MAG TPA: hypothetical protein [Caudoviricetes sp.]
MDFLYYTYLFSHIMKFSTIKNINQSIFISF